MKALLLLVVVWLSGLSFAWADIVNPLEINKVVKSTEVRAEIMGSNIWLSGASLRPDDDSYNGIVDYRVETKTPMYDLKGHEGNLITRTQGIGYFDSNIQDFFSDRLIDLPELFMMDSFNYGDDLKVDVVFGKFAHRRFIDKNEIVRDPFDIGERAYFGQNTGTNNLLALINQNREGLGRYTSKIATGSYGFLLALKDTSGDSFWDRWSVKQAFAVAEMDNFGENFYQVTNITKNWGSMENPGQFDIGYLYAQNRVFLRASSTEDSHIFFTSLAQRRDKFAIYGRYGIGFVGLFDGDNTNINNIQIGASYDLTKKDILGIEYVSLNSNEPVLFDSSDAITGYWTHSFNKHLNLNTFLGFGKGTFDPTTPGGSDNNWTIGFNLQGLL